MISMTSLANYTIGDSPLLPVKKYDAEVEERACMKEEKMQTKMKTAVISNHNKSEYNHLKEMERAAQSGKQQPRTKEHRFSKEEGSRSAGKEGWNCRSKILVCRKKRRLQIYPRSPCQGCLNRVKVVKFINGET